MQQAAKIQSDMSFRALEVGVVSGLDRERSETYVACMI